MKNFNLIFFIILSVLIAGFSLVEAEEPIKIGIVDWADAVAPALLAESIIEDYYDKPVEISYVQKEISYQGVATDNFDITFSLWLPNSDYRHVYRFREDIEVLPTAYFYDAVLGLYIPDYVPIDSIDDLNDPEIAKKFNNKIVGIDPGATLTSLTEDVLEEYNLSDKYTLINSSSAGMMAALNRAIEKEEWIIVTLWKPHWAFSVYDVKILNDPLTIYGTAENVHIGVTTEFRQEYPEISKALIRMELNTPDFPGIDEEIAGEQYDYLAEMMLKGKEAETFEEGAYDWMDNHKEVIDKWVNP